MDLEGKGSEQFHVFSRGQTYSSGVWTEHYTVDTMQLKYVSYFLTGPINVFAWSYYLPGFGYTPKTF